MARKKHVDCQLKVFVVYILVLSHCQRPIRSKTLSSGGIENDKETKLNVVPLVVTAEIKVKPH